VESKNVVNPPEKDITNNQGNRSLRPPPQETEEKRRVAMKKQAYTVISALVFTILFAFSTARAQSTNQLVALQAEAKQRPAAQKVAGLACLRQGHFIAFDRDRSYNSQHSTSPLPTEGSQP
jgi:hypothetical protein